MFGYEKLMKKLQRAKISFEIDYEDLWIPQFWTYDRLTKS